MSSATAIAEALRQRTSFILTSHARPDGDAIGSQLALALALDRLGKTVRLVDRDPAPLPYRTFPGVDRIEVSTAVEGPADAVVLLECSDPGRPEVAGLERYSLINVDHHLGNTMYGEINWFDPTAAACGEMVAEIIDALGVPWTRDMATHLYLAISTDTGGFRFGPITGRTFEICRRIAETGLDLPTLSRSIFDSYSLGRVRLMGSLLSRMELHCGNRLAILSFDDALLERYGASADDTEGLVNVPLGAREIVAVALFKTQNGALRLSLRSKGAVDVRSVAARWQGGGHRNAAGCTIEGDADAIKAEIIDAMTDAIEAAAGGSSVSV
jgi:phosphoesterase RecJ-like protein